MNFKNKLIQFVSVFVFTCCAYGSQIEELSIKITRYRSNTYLHVFDKGGDIIKRSLPADEDEGTISGIIKYDKFGNVFLDGKQNGKINIETFGAVTVSDFEGFLDLTADSVIFQGNTTILGTERFDVSNFTQIENGLLELVSGTYNFEKLNNLGIISAISNLVVDLKSSIGIQLGHLSAPNKLSFKTPGMNLQVLREKCGLVLNKDQLVYVNGRSLSKSTNQNSTSDPQRTHYILDSKGTYEAEEAWQRKAIFDLNQEISNGSYQLQGSSEIYDVKSAVGKGKQRNFSVFSGGKDHRGRNYDLSKYQKKYSTKFTVVNQDTLDCAIALKKGQELLNPLAIDMAHAENPTGGAPSGHGNVQEEQMAYRSALYAALMEEYRKNNQLSHAELPGQYFIPMQGGICVPGVAVFRNGVDKGYSFREPVYVDIFAVAAFRHLNRKFLAPNRAGKVDEDIFPELQNTGTYWAYMKNKIRSMFVAALVNGNDSLVLGALGTGVFENPVPKVVNLFAEVAREFDGYFQKIVFAVLDRDGQTIKQFEQVFANRTVFDNFKPLQVTTNQKTIISQIKHQAKFALRRDGRGAKTWLWQLKNLLDREKQARRNLKLVNALYKFLLNECEFDFALATKNPNEQKQIFEQRVASVDKNEVKSRQRIARYGQPNDRAAKRNAIKWLVRLKTAVEGAKGKGVQSAHMQSLDKQLLKKDCFDLNQIKYGRLSMSKPAWAIKLTGQPASREIQKATRLINKTKPADVTNLASRAMQRKGKGNSIDRLVELRTAMEILKNDPGSQKKLAILNQALTASRFDFGRVKWSLTSASKKVQSKPTWWIGQ
ncbi:MAG: TIGR02452 family protein [Pseudomonadota bacterium]